MNFDDFDDIIVVIEEEEFNNDDDDDKKEQATNRQKDLIHKILHSLKHHFPHSRDPNKDKSNDNKYKVDKRDNNSKKKTFGHKLLNYLHIPHHRHENEKKTTPRGANIN
nr:7234_t:CDS:1 [Entrophospora candida]